MLIHVNVCWSGHEINVLKSFLAYLLSDTDVGLLKVVTRPVIVSLF